MSNRAPLLVAVLLLASAFAGCAGPSGADAETITETSMASGSQATLPLALENATWSADNVTVEAVDTAGLDVSTSDEVQIVDGTLAAWVDVSVPDDAEPGPHDVQLEVSGSGGDARTVEFALTVVDPGDGIPQGQIAVVNFTALTQDGQLALTNNANVAQAPFDEAPGFQEPRGFQPTPVPISQQARFPTELVQALSGASVNQTLTVDVPEAFGPAERQQNVTREETLERNRTAPRAFSLPKQQAAQQGLIDRQTEEGDSVELPTSELPYVVDQLNQTHVRIEVDVSEGDNVTLHQAWPDATKVLNLTEENVTVRTTPNVDEGETFTWRDSWPDATELVRVTNESIVIRHSPEEGLTYTEQTRQGVQNVTVEEVQESQIVLSRENPHPLGGETLSFTMTVVDQREPRRQPGGGAPSPR